MARSLESDSELVARDLGLSISEVESVLAFRAEVQQKISEVPGLVRYGWDELPSRAGFVEVVGSATGANIESLDELGIRVVDGFVYTAEERRARVRAVTGYLVENGFKGAIVRHVGDQVLVDLAESQHHTIDPSILGEALLAVTSAAVEDKATASAGGDQVTIRPVPDSGIPTRRVRREPPNDA